MRTVRTPLYWRLLIWFCAANLLALVLGGLLAQGFIAYSTRAEVSWAALAQAANRAYETGGQRALAAWSMRTGNRGIEATLYEHGRALYPIHLHPRAEAQLPKWLASGKRVVTQPDAAVAIAVQPVIGADGRLRQLVAVGHARLRPHARAAIYLLIPMLMALLFIGVVGWWVARSVSRPVEALRIATQRITGGELSIRVAPQRGSAHDELAQLARDFNAMAARIEALMAHDRAVLRDLSHELRSPLARLQLILDLAQGSTDRAAAASYFAQAEREVTGLDRMLGDMLDLSRLESGLPGAARQPVQLAAVVRRCVERYRLDAATRGITLQPTPVAPVTMLGESALLEHALDNLLANAIKFNPRGAPVTVALEADGRQGRLTVRDHGPGVPDSELPQLFRPFFRGSNAGRASGHGLGLTIVQRVVQVHGGSVDARNAEGGGLAIRVTLPLA